MKQSELQKIVNEEIQAVLEISMTKRFTKAVEELQKIQLAQQKLRKQFVAEKDPTKKEKLKQAIIKMHKVVQKVEQNFNDAIKGEPVEDIEEGKDSDGFDDHIVKSTANKTSADNLEKELNKAKVPYKTEKLGKVVMFYFKSYKDYEKAEDIIRKKRIQLESVKEGKLTEAKLARGLKPLLKLGSIITKKAGEAALIKLSDKFDRIDDEYAGEIASWLDMAIELHQDGYLGDATKKLKQFNKKCKDVLKGKSIKSAFAEGKLNEAEYGTPIGTKTLKSIDAKFDDEVFKKPPHRIDKAWVLKIAKKYKVDPKKAIEWVNQNPKINIKEGKLNERSKTAKQYGLSDDFDDAVADLKDKEFTTKGITNLAKKHRQNPKKAIMYVKDAFEWLWKEGKINEANFVDQFLDRDENRKNNIKFYNAVEKLKSKDMNKRFLQKLAKKLDVDPKDALRFVKEMWISKFEAVRSNKLNINEDVYDDLKGDIPGSKIYTAHNTDKRKSVEARKTDKVWDDGVPVLKYIARASKKSSPLPKGKFKIVDDSKYGWWYYQVGKTWYGIQQKDYGTPPFEY